MITVQSIRIRGFYKVEDVFMSLSEPGVHAVVGRNLDGGSQSNGAGKSTIFEALTWCLYDRTARGPYKPDQFCCVEVRLEDDDYVHSIERKRENDSPSLRIRAKLKRGGEEDAIELSGRNVATGNDIVVGLLGMDYDTFTRSAYFPQEGVIPFGYLTDKVLKEFFLEKFLDIGWISACYELAKDDVTGLEKRKIVSQGEIDSVTYKIEHLLELLKDGEDHRKKWESGRKDKLKRLQEEIKEAEKILKRYSERILDSRSVSLKKEIESIKMKVIKYEEAEKSARQYLDIFVRKLSQNDLRIAQLNKEEEKIVGKLGNIESLIGTTCSQCGNKITRWGLSVHESKLRNRLVDLKAEIEPIKKLLDNDSNRCNKFNDVVVRLKRQMDLLNKESRVLYESLASLANPEEEKLIKRVEAKMRDNKAEVVALRIMENPHEKRIATYKDEMKTYRDTIESEEEKIEKYNEELLAARFWQEGFGVQGIQSFLLETVTPVLNSKIKRYLDIISDGMLKSEFHTVTKLKSGEYRERFGLSATKVGGADSYRGLSGGEKARVNLAVSLALGEMKRMQSEKEVNLLILDEPFNGLDSQGVSDVLGLLREHFDQKPLYLVSHVDVDPSMVDDLIMVKYENGVTSLDV